MRNPRLREGAGLPGGRIAAAGQCAVTVGVAADLHDLGVAHGEDLVERLRRCGSGALRAAAHHQAEHRGVAVDLDAAHAGLQPLGRTAALKARDAEALAALRTAIAAIDNAEAIATTDARRPVTSADIAGASSGVGSTEAVRQSLSPGQLRDIVREQITEYAREADRYDALGQPDAAYRLRHRARILADHVAPE
jgi:hypothetical protein